MEAAMEKLAHTSLDGNDWLLCKGQGNDLAAVLNGQKDFLPAEVPGNVQSDLENARELLPLWYGMGDERLLDVCRTGWWYKKEFAVPETGAQRHALVFDGVDYACDIYLNGTHVCSHEGMFLRFTVDVTGHVVAGSKNTLCVYIHPMPEELVPWLVNSDGKQSGEGTEYFFVNANDAIRKSLKGLKSPSVCSYDWGTNIYTLGIWRSVTLESTGPVRAEYLQVKTKLGHGFGTAEIQPVLELQSSEEMDVQALYTLVGPDGTAVRFGKAGRVPVGESRFACSFQLENPLLWWPAGHGEQPLYTLQATIKNANGETLCEKSARFGIREVVWELTEGAPKDFPHRFALRINGRRVRTMGSNLVTPDLLPARAAKRGRHFIQMAKEAGMNTLRQHGGQPTLPNSVYEAADELGIMLLVDYPIANCVPENEPVFLQNFSRTVADITKQLRNHPSIIEWSGGNELNWYFDPAADHTALEVQRGAVAAEDDREFRPTCPIYGSRHAPWVYNPELHYKEFNREIKDNFGETPLMRYGEFGTQTPANLETWLRDIPEASRWPVRLEDEILIRKNAVEAVFSPHAWLMLPTIEQFFGPLEGIEDAIKAGQLLGAEGLRYMMDALRAMGGRLGGFTNWDYNEPWPNGAGSFLVDYDGVPVMGYHFAKQALQPLALQLKYDSIKFSMVGSTFATLRLVSDAPQAVEGLHWRAVLRDRHGAEYRRAEGRASISPLEVQHLCELEITPPERSLMGPVFCELSLYANDESLVTERLHYFVPEGVEHPLRGLLYDVPDRPFGVPYSTTGMVPGRVKQTGLEIEDVKWAGQNGEERCEIALKNTGDMTALYLHPQPTLAYRKDLFVEGDYTSIPPKESRTLTIRCVESPFALRETGFTLQGWNTNELCIEPAPNVLLWFGTQNGTCREYATDAALQSSDPAVEGRSLDTSRLYYLQEEPIGLQFTTKGQKGSVQLHLAMADSAPEGGEVCASLNGAEVCAVLPMGYGVQKNQPGQYAKPAELVFTFPEGALAEGENVLTVAPKKGWFTWDSLRLFTD